MFYLSDNINYVHANLGNNTQYFINNHISFNIVSAGTVQYTVLLHCLLQILGCPGNAFWSRIVAQVLNTCPAGHFRAEGGQFADADCDQGTDEQLRQMCDGQQCDVLDNGIELLQKKEMM